MAQKAKKEAKKKEKKSINLAKIYVTATFNNTIVTATDLDGNAIAWATAGTVGFKGTRKSTPFAATTAVGKLAQKLLGIGVKEVDIYIKGPGPGRDAALRSIRASGLKMNMIADVTPIPHNGTRAKKKRRV